MKAISRVPYALSVCAAAAMLVGCRRLGPASKSCGADIARQRRHHISGRVAKFRDARAHGRQLFPALRSLLGRLGSRATKALLSPDGHVSHAHGNAAGPYPGTFLASGNWKIRFYAIQGGLIGFWFFYERFTITSGSSKISGTIKGRGEGSEGSHQFFPTCESLGPSNMQYTSNSGSGNADIEIIQKGKGDFSETLDGL